MTKVDMIIGMQYGGEGKGTLSAMMPHLKSKIYDLLIATSTPQSGHTCYHENKKVVLHHIPCAVITNYTKKVYVPAGTVLNINTLHDDMKTLRDIGIECQVIVDSAVTVIRDDNIEEEKDLNLMKTVGSTQSGTGSALSRRILRYEDQILNERDCEKLRDNGIGVRDRRDVRFKGDILIEASQGILLSNYSHNYPFTTSMPVCPMSTLSKCQFYPDELTVYGMARYYPIRVGGNSGDMGNEITWDEIGVEPEMTTVTQRQRRVGTINVDEVIAYSKYFGIKKMVLNFINYVYKSIEGADDMRYKSTFDLVITDTVVSQLVDYFDSLYLILNKHGDIAKISSTGNIVTYKGKEHQGFHISSF